MVKLFSILALCFVSLSATAAPLGIMVPAYFYPADSNYWGALDYAAARVPLIVILNPDSGPGAAPDASYVTAATSLHKAGGQLIGYVATGYTTSNLVSQVEFCIDRYLSYYAVDGFFLDEMANDADTNHVNYYASIYQYIKAKNSRFTVTGNPGTDTEESYLTRPTADMLMVFENGSGYTNWVPAGWITNHLARQFIHVPYGVGTAAAMSNCVNLAVGRNAGWVYITNDKGSNPYDTLPTYWTNEVALVQSLNLAAPATHVAVAGVTNKIPR